MTNQNQEKPTCLGGHCSTSWDRVSSRKATNCRYWIANTLSRQISLIVRPSRLQTPSGDVKKKHIGVSYNGGSPVVTIGFNTDGPRWGWYHDLLRRRPVELFHHHSPEISSSPGHVATSHLTQFPGININESTNQQSWLEARKSPFGVRAKLGDPKVVQLLQQRL